MTLSPSELVQALAKVWPAGGLPSELPSLPERINITSDSRQITPGDVFVAIPGGRFDGRDFIDNAIAAGAGLVLAHVSQGDITLQGRVLQLPYLTRRLGELGRALFQLPEGPEVIGVTGTNGKSSVTHYIAALSDALGTSAGVIGTLGVGRLGALRDTGLTTPGTLTMHAALGELARQGVKRVALEVSSHSLDQSRLDSVDITAGVFTNLSRDHLDYHGSMAAYAATKAKLFRRTELTLAVVNGDDSLARLMLAGCDSHVRVLATGQDEAVTLRVVGWHPHSQGQQALIATPEGEKALSLSLMGRFNLDNVLLAMATLYGLGEPLEALFDAAASLAPVPGRMECYRQAGAPSVVVDYAHTPDALDNALRALASHAGRLWCVFGCGGERDTGKRAEMARVAETHADSVIVTDDNPRGEPADGIRQAILAGFSHQAQPLEIAKRGEAIAYAVRHASPDDVILVAGKGHEPYQEIQGVRYPYHDGEAVQAALATRGVR
ncbi:MULTISPECIES: UDP-N-acetylmuramoyl-L-alanyl-D-glutamate--2,6-diaminopimelate ligase [unclassified Halomonas]|uniref:UDP-N-acetylmuramoyl-L-alanyl-D-glutamate--2, 6-diaminopimelate ligase n=1 Tax=unclassified Halomonas TaxID=2609666 RepID=UPI0006DA6399|nr:MULTISPECIES: UDP-N-acetylmuramoyl-L-alanyl-D-glutamate--2,6-diaminopimelate ligase [unclassified Halomonas]KPQ26598.1 MAG: UDP-N-acetylmuramoyl-L-alanyl-D-glutamate--2,6-diaminopimelate ligase MurE [Halomonas sp. HL-93]SBR49604.1 UDP-N-acetylmuramoylalanyl-D-glutamate--2,6-diaminopimelate ligase [Halomonas sp. HL-93]SNY96449.1 UDP-N-acetylmuramoylalanyl-D-glutamate--2,6-diaminopimelate ligase [Halomonas sp. hl-4]